MMTVTTEAAEEVAQAEDATMAEAGMAILADTRKLRAGGGKNAANKFRIGRCGGLFFFIQ
jgi:hypothetical protein